MRTSPGGEPDFALIIEQELTTIAAAAWHRAHVLVVQATGLWYLYGGPRLNGKLEDFIELGCSREEAEARLRQLLAASNDASEGERRLTVQELRSHRPGER